MEFFDTTTVATVVEPNVRSQVDAAVGEEFTALHTNSMGEALLETSEMRVGPVE